MTASPHLSCIQGTDSQLRQAPRKAATVQGHMGQPSLTPVTPTLSYSTALQHFGTQPPTPLHTEELKPAACLAALHKKDTNYCITGTTKTAREGDRRWVLTFWGISLLSSHTWARGESRSCMQGGVRSGVHPNAQVLGD